MHAAPQQHSDADKHLRALAIISCDSCCRWWKDSNVRLALLASGICAFLYNFQDEMAPLFVSAPVKQVQPSKSFHNLSFLLFMR